MLKKDLELKLKKYEEIIFEIGRWINPLQYKLNEKTSQKTLLFHIEGISNILDKKFYNTEGARL